MELHLINFNTELALAKSPMPPLGLLSLYAYLKEKGFTRVDILDLLKYNYVEIQKQQFQKYVENLDANDQHVLGFYMNSFNRFEVKELVGFTRRALPKSIVIAGGPHPTLATGDTLQSIPEIDILVKGEGEIILYNLIEKLQQNFSVEAVKDVKGISYRCNGQLFDNGREKRIENLDVLPFPDRKAVDMSTYPILLPMLKPVEGIKVTTLMSSRGCPYKCIFCSIAEQWERLNTYRNPPSILKELDYLNKEFGYNAFYFFDEIFTLHRNRTIDFCRLLIKEKREYYWFCEVRADTVDYDLLKLMYEAGCRSIAMGVESGSQKLLNEVVFKGIDLQRVKEVVKWCNEIGIYIKCCFTYSYPGETFEQVLETLAFRENLPANLKPIGQIRIYPGTPIFRYAQKQHMMPEGFTWFRKYSFYRTDFNPSIMPLFIDKLTHEQLLDIKNRLNPVPLERCSGTNWKRILKPKLTHLLHIMKHAFLAPVYKFLSLRMYRILAATTGKIMVHVLHIGRTGGSAIKYALRCGKPIITGKHIIFTHNHRFGFKDALPGEKIVFFVRDPIDRFVSSFYYRKSKGQPWYYFEWSAAEMEAFSTFKTPNELAASLSSGDPGKRDKAVKAMKNIAHLNTSYWRWFINERYFLRRKNDVLFIGAQKDMNGDFVRLKEILGLPKDIELPLDQKQRNANPTDIDKRLDDEAIINLKSWYNRDFQFMELLQDNNLL